MYTLKFYQPYISFSISLKKASHFLFAACHKAKKENKVKISIIYKEKSEVDANKAYLHFFSEDSSLNIDNLSGSSKIDDNDQDYWEDMALNFQKKI